MHIRALAISEKTFVRNVATMISGTAAAQLISIGLSPVITRLYGPEAYGLMGIFIAITFVIAPVAALTYPIAIVLPEQNEEASGIVRLSLYVTAGMSALLALLLFLFHDAIVNFFNLEKIAVYLYLIPLVILFSGYLQVTEQWMIRTKQFRLTAKAEVIQSAILQGSRLGMGIIYPAAAVLILTASLAVGLKALILNRILKKNGDFSSRIHVNKNPDFKSLARKYKDFPVFRAPQTFLFAVSESLPVLMLAGFFGPASAGLYSIGKTVLNMPAHLIGKSFGDVFYSRFSEAAKNGENLPKLLVSATLSLALMGVVPFGLIMALGPQIFGAVFGAEWFAAGEYARWVAVWLFFGFLNKPSVMALPVLSAQAFHLKYTVFMLLTWVSGLAAGYYFFKDDLTAVAIFGVTGGLLNIGLIVMTVLISKRENLKVLIETD